MTSVSYPINWVLRAEGFTVFVFSLGMYSSLELSWIAFTILFLVPDISFIGYLANDKTGAISYNIAHSYIGAIIALSLGYFFSIEWASLIGLIWLAHIGFDRTLGYGLKYGVGFGFTHLGLIGKAKGV